MTAPNKMAKRAAAGTLALAVCFTGGLVAATSASAAPGFKFDTRISGADRTATSIAASKAAFKDGSSTVIIVERDAVVDGLTASYIAGTNKAPILYVDRQGVPDEIAAEIKRLGATKAILVGGTAVLPKAAVADKLQSSGLTVERQSGSDRYATAQAVALSGSKTPDKILIASGESPADALAAGPIAYAKNYPLVLVRPDSVPVATSDALGKLGEGERIVIGGTARVSGSTYDALGADRRLSGPNRQATAIAIANVATGELGFNKDRVALVSDADRAAVDALVASPVAGSNLAPLLFTSGSILGGDTTDYLKAHAAELTGPGYIFGGTAAVTAEAAQQGTDAAQGSDKPEPPAPGSDVTVGSTVIQGQEVGTGTAQSPAVSYGKDITVDATLTGSGGQALGGLDTTLVVRGTVVPTVNLPNGSPARRLTTDAANIYFFTVPTDSSGKAQAVISVASGSKASYDIQFLGPASDTNNQSVKNDNAYIQFVPENSLGVSPFGDTNNPYLVARSSTNEPAIGNTAVVATLPPLNGQPQKNVKVTFTIAGGSAFFATATGTPATGAGATTVEAFTDGNGQASVYVNDLTDEGVNTTVTATPVGRSGETTVLRFGQAGIPQSVKDLSASGIRSGSGTAGDPYESYVDGVLTLSGTVLDSTKQPVAGAKLLITSDGGRGSFVTGSGDDAKTTAFSNAAPVTNATVTDNGAPYGTLVTTDSSGRFSVKVTDSKLSNVTNPTDVYRIFPVANGIVQRGSIAGTDGIQVKYTANTTAVSGLGVATGDGLTAAYNANSKVAPSELKDISFQVANLNPDGQFGAVAPKTLEFGAFNAAKNDYLYNNAGATVSYQVSASAESKAFIGSIDGVKLDGTAGTGLPNKPKSVTVSLTSGAATAGVRTVTVRVNNVPIGTFDLNYDTPNSLTASNAAASAGVTGFTLPTDVTGTDAAGPYAASFINVGVADATAETATFTATVNGKSATATVKFSASKVAELTSNPSVASPADGTAQTITYTAKDANGNAVANAPVTLVSPENAAGLNIIKVNGTNLTQNIGANNTAVPTPIRLGAAATGQNYNVVVPGVVSYTDGDNVVVTTDADGKFSITLQDANVSYYNVTGTTVASDGRNYNGSVYLVEDTSTLGTTAFTLGATAAAGADQVNRTTVNY